MNPLLQISMQLLGWFVHDVIPKFPGLLASGTFTVLFDSTAVY